MYVVIFQMFFRVFIGYERGFTYFGFYLIIISLQAYLYARQQLA